MVLILELGKEKIEIHCSLLWERELGKIHDGPSFLPFLSNPTLDEYAQNTEVLSSELSLEAEDVQLPFHGDYISAVSNGTT